VEVTSMLNGIRKQVMLAWDETIGPYINSIDDGCESDLATLTKADLINTLYLNVVQCHFEKGLVKIGTNENRFNGKDLVMKIINELWDNDYQGDVSAIKPYLSNV
jgi:hypothetical protein